MDKEKPHRTFPIVLLVVSGIFSSAASAWGGISAIILSLGYVMFTMSFFLVLIAVFHRIKIRLQRGKEKAGEKGETFGAFLYASPVMSPVKKLITRAWAHVADFYLEESKEPHSEDAGSARDVPQQTGGLVAIQKETSVSHGEGFVLPARAKLEITYTAVFLAIALWRIIRMFAIVPLRYTEFYYSIADAVLLLVFPFIAMIYLKMRKDEGSYPGDTTSRDMLTLLSFVSLLYAAVIAVTLVLTVHILAVLRWVFYATMVYLIAALAVNILLSVVMNKTIGDFNYPLIPKRSKAGDKETGFLDSEELRLNFSIKSLYTVKYTLKVLPGLFLALAVLLLASTTFFVVQPHQQAAVFRSGRLDRSSIVTEGLHFKLPWPVSRVVMYDTHRIKAMQIGYQSPDAIHFLWTQLRDGEYLLLLGNGNEKVSVNMRIMYTISDLYLYIKSSNNPEAILSAAAYEALMNRTVNTTLDAFLSIDRSSLSASILEELSEFAQGLGLSVVQVIIEGIHPPAEVADVYQMVVSASIDRNTIITAAQTESEKRRIDAYRQNRSIVNYATARQYYRFSAAIQEMAVVYAAMEAYQINPESFRLTRNLDSFERVIGSGNVHVFSPGMENSIQRSIMGSPQAPVIMGGGAHE